MKRFVMGVLFFGIALRGAFAADSVVVLNEIHYHPATNETVTEWVELHNQMAIDIDLSAWSVRGEIDFTFPEGTIIPGGGHLVIASNPSALQTNTGITNVVGPFTGRLNNSSAVIRLRDRNDRLMDEIEYRDGGKWPVAPDGSGATLAKRGPNLNSSSPENWTSSVLVGGTPGARNFPAASSTQRRALIPLNALWRFEASGNDLGTTWRNPDFNDSSWAGRNNATLVSYWPFNGNATATRGTNGTFAGAVTTAFDRNGIAGGALAFSGASQYVNVPGGGGLNAATAGTISMWVKWIGTQDADCCGTFGAVLARQGNGIFSDNILALNTSSPSTARIVWRQSGGPAPVLITGTTTVGTNWHHIVITFGPSGSTLYLDGDVQGTAGGSALNNGASVPLSIGAWAGDGAGFSTSSIDDVAIWDQPLSAAQIAELTAQTKSPLDFVTPESAIYFAGDGRLTSNDELRRTALPLGPNTYYFRTTFQFGDDPSRTQLALDLALDDGAVFYLNGAEAYRHNMSGGAVNYSTLAASSVGDAPIVNGISLPATNLVQGTNVLAVEVHQAVAADSGMAFGAGLTAHVSSVPPIPATEDFAPGGLVFNEITAASTNAFRIELMNKGAQSLNAAGYVVLRSGPSPDVEYTLASQDVAPGGFLVLNQATLGFGAVPGDKLMLFLPGRRAVADAVEVHERPRARSPDGAGEWATPNTGTLGASNSFAFRDEVVINEIMYHAPPTLEVPAVIGSSTIITFSNVWSYNESGTDIGTAWRAPGYNDDAWLVGTGLFYHTAANLPAPKNTALALSNAAGAPIVTHYFRTTFVYTGAPAIRSMNLRHIVDDGVVLYLNGTEISRFNIPAGAPVFTNNATSSIGNTAVRSGGAVSVTNLLIGTNVLAAEVHQAVISGGDVVFGAELTAVVETVPRIPYAPSPEQWIELFNRSSNAVNLSGWRLDEAVDFRFASNTMIPSGGYLVAAKDPAALLAKFPGVLVVGPYTNSLSHRTGRVVIKDANDNIADVVPYFDDGRWPEAADAGGASLELRDPWADNSAGGAWAASDEKSRSSWRAYSYRGIAAASPVGPDGQWREFVIGLLDSGEVLLDDITVIETPATTPTNLIQNSTFDTGTNKWRIIGNHHGEVIDDPDQPGNKVLRLVATGATEHMSNHGETTFVGNRDVVNGREYLISFRAKWISGSRQFHTRLYFNRLPRVTLLDAPTLYGTPGARNSTFTTNIGPTFAAFRHEPVVPAPFAPVTVSVQADDPDGVAVMTLWSRLDGGTWNSSAMSVSTVGVYAATLPGRVAGAVVQFYVEGTDALGARSLFPATGTNSRALYEVDDGLAATNGLHNMRLVMLTADADTLFRTVNLMSNERIDGTVIYDEQEVFYGVGIRLKGSEHSRTTTPRLGFSIGFNSEQLFRGIHRSVMLDRSESVGFGQREMLIHQTLNHAGGTTTKYHDLTQVISPRSEYTGSAELQLARYTDVFLDDQFDNGSDGMVFEYELVYQLNSTDNQTPEGNKVPAPDSVVGTTIRNLGDDKEGYRWNFLIKNNEDRDDYSRLIPFAKAMELSGPAFLAQIANLIDVELWLRGTAVNVLSGCGDSYGGDGSQHNVQFYAHPNGRMIYFPHDMDAFFDANRAIVPNGDLTKLIAQPAYARAYYGHLLDIIATTYNGAYMTRWANHFKRLLPAQDFAGHLAFIIQRAGIVTSRVNAAVPNMAFAITSNGGNNFGTSNNVITLAGTAPLSVKTIEVNGVSYALNWTSTTAWSLMVPLQSGTNLLAVQGVDRNGVRLTNAVDMITVTNSGTSAPLPIVINEWMADDAGPGGFVDPADGLFQDWFELFNPNNAAVNLSGYFLTDILSQPAKWAIPTNTVIAPRGFLLVWADEDGLQNGTGTSGDLHANFRLSADGEALGLFSPNGTVQHVITFGPQSQNVSQGLFPDGNTNGIYFMTNWTPRRANQLGPPPSPQLGLRLGPGEVATLSFTTTPGRTYRVEFKDALGDPAWLTLVSRTANDSLLTVTNDITGQPQRFYRVSLVP